MSDAQKRGGRRNRSGKSTLSTRSGATIKVNRSLSDRIKARRDNRARRRANRLSTLPKSRVKRMLFRLHPRHLAAYWFSRDGVIMGLKLMGVGIVVIFVVLVGLFAYFRKDLPDLTNISGGNLGGSISYYDRTGTILLFQDYDAVKRVAVQSDQISQYMKDATVAAEDKNFYHEGAISVSGILRAGLHDVTGGGGGGLQGASTITEQVVKLNENWIGNRTISTKIKEIILAVDLEREYSKNDILTGYLNVAPYGGIDYGVQAAAQDYFGENASQLDLAQSAMLAAIPQSPSYYSPYSSPQFNSAASTDEFGEGALIGRQEYILDQMVKQHFITEAQATAAKAENVMSEIHPLANKYANIQAPYFVLAAKQQLENEYTAATVERGGWKVITTLNMNLENVAEGDVAANLPNVERNKGDEEAIVAESVPTGQILAEVGGVNFNNPDYGQINYAQTDIPPGSSFKPYDYSSFINDETDAGAGSVLYDVQQPLPGYPCTDKSLPPPNGTGNCLEDYDFRYPGAETLRYALAGSRNVPAVKTMLTVGVNRVIQTADEMMDVPNAYQCYSDVALTQPTQCYGSAAIGDGAYLHLDEHVNGLATDARLGAAIPETYILKIVDSNNKTIYQWTQPKPTQVVRPDAAYIVDNILSDPNASYLPSFQKFQHYDGWDIAVKTGTTNDNYDGLMTAWTTQIAVASWVGYHTRNVALTAGQMENLTEPLTRNFIETALTDLDIKPINWVQPSDIKVLPAYVQRTHVGLGSVEPGPSTDLFPSWYVQPKGSGTETIDKVSGDIATTCTPALAKEVVGGGNDSVYSADIFWPIAKSTNTAVSSATDTVHNCSDSPPTVTLTVTDLDPTDPSPTNNCNGSCTVTITVNQGTHPLSDPTNYPQFPGTINFSVNGTVAETFNINNIAGADCASQSPPNNCTVSFTYTPTATGSETFTAQVIDSVLYESSNQATVATTVPSASDSNSAPSNQQTTGQGH
jgi:penicillin-binding protein 1A